MKVEKVGEIFIDGKIIDLDNSSNEDLNKALQEINSRKEITLDKIDKLLEEVQD